MTRDQLAAFTISRHKFTFSDIDECEPDPCMNGGTCVDGVNGFNCSCTAGFVGDTCNAS